MSAIAEEYPDEVGIQFELWKIESRHDGKAAAEPAKPGEPDFATAEY